MCFDLKWNKMSGILSLKKNKKFENDGSDHGADQAGGADYVYLTGQLCMSSTVRVRLEKRRFKLLNVFKD